MAIGLLTESLFPFLVCVTRAFVAVVAVVPPLLIVVVNVTHLMDLVPFRLTPIALLAPIDAKRDG
jgi:hypothetical protein